jgi:hypothetical protein
MALAAAEALERAAARSRVAGRDLELPARRNAAGRMEGLHVHRRRQPLCAPQGGGDDVGTSERDDPGNERGECRR